MPDTQEKGFEVLDIPCNQFGHQTPGTDEEITEFCTMNYKTQFPQMHKSDVNGENELPLYTFLKSQKGGLLGKKIKWNFAKFLVDRDGNVVKRFPPTSDPKDFDADVAALI